LLFFVVLGLGGSNGEVSASSDGLQTGW